MGSMIHEELGEYLTLISRDGAYRVVATLKESAFETTEQVVFCGANGAERGPYVRKRIARQAGLGAVYQELLRAQRQGRRFVHLPHIEECYELGEEFVVVMEHVEGATLHELVYERDPSWELASEVFPLLCDAVSELHEGLEAPIIHRDLKPSNVILSAANLTLIDFGIARAYRDGAERDTAAFGTRAYAPPEQFGFGQTDVRSDVYALGMLLYYLLTEQVPSPALAGGPFAEAAVPQALRPVLAKATAFDPAARYGSARELKDAFEAAGVPQGAAGDGASAGLAGGVVSAGMAGGMGAADAASGVASGLAGGVALPGMPPGAMLAGTASPPPAVVPAPRPAASGPVEQPARRLARGLWRATEWAGVAWDAFVVLLMAATVTAGVNLSMGSQGAAAGEPLWARAWQYGGICLMLLGAEWVVLDWRLLRRRVPSLAHLPWRRSVAVGLLVALGGFLAALVGAIVSALLFPKG